MPDNVTEPLLWRLAIDVLAAHQPDDGGRCRNPQCAEHTAPCPPSVAARHAMRLARPAPAPPAPHPAAGTADTVARGRATVPAPLDGGRFTGWFITSLLPGPWRNPVPVPPVAMAAV
jgi:hypothetical protein